MLEFNRLLDRPQDIQRKPVDLGSDNSAYRNSSLIAAESQRRVARVSSVTKHMKHANEHEEDTFPLLGT